MGFFHRSMKERETLHQPVIELHVPEKLTRRQADLVGGGEEVVEFEGLFGHFSTGFFEG